MGLVLAVPIVLIVLLVALGSVGRSFQRGLGHDRCAHCDAKLRRHGRRYATVCAKCGEAQPWAKRT